MCRPTGQQGLDQSNLDARANDSVNDIRSVVLPAMRHRCLLSFEGKTTDETLQNFVDTLPTDVGVSAGAAWSDDRRRHAQNTRHNARDSPMA